MLEREDELGGCIRTAELTEPGYLHDVFSAWHPLWVGGAAHAELADELAAARARVPEHRPPDGDADARGRGHVPAALDRGQRRRAGRGVARRGRVVPAERRPGLRRARHRAVVARRACGSACARTGGSVAAARSSSSATCSPRAATGSRRRSPSERAHGVLAPWVLHTGLGPDNAGSGFMTQVIGVAVQEGGMPIPRGGGARLVEALVRLIEDNGGSCETGRDVERVLVRDGKAAGVRTADGEEIQATPRGDRQRDADAALRPARRRPRGARPPLPLRALGDADPLRAVGAAALGGRRAARADGDRAPDARPRRRLARGQRGRARAAAGRGDRRGRPAADDGPEPGTRQAPGCSGSSCRSCRGR